MKKHLLPSVKLTLLFAVFFMGIYTLVMLGIAQVAPNNGKGFVVEYNGDNYYENIAQMQARIDTFMVHNPGISKSEIPSDMVTASGSGQDPNISVQGAMVQVKRIAKARALTENTLHELIVQNTEKPILGLFGTEKINVLKLNIALNNLK